MFPTLTDWLYLRSGLMNTVRYIRQVSFPYSIILLEFAEGRFKMVRGPHFGRPCCKQTKLAGALCSSGLNVHSMLKHEALVLTLNAVRFLEEKLLWHDVRFSALYPFSLPYSDLPWDPASTETIHVFFMCLLCHTKTINNANCNKKSCI